MHDQRTLEKTRQGVIVVAQERETAEREQILNGDMFTELDPIGACHWDTQEMELADHRVEEAIPCPDQDQNIAGLNRSSPRIDNPFLIEPRSDRPGDVSGKPQ